MRLLEGSVVIVTGAGRGLGRAHALALTDAGATVVVNDLGVTLRGEPEDGGSPADSVVAEIENLGGTALADGTSVTDWDGIETLVARVVDRFGRLDGAVNNAGFLRDKQSDGWDRLDPANASPVVAWLTSRESGWRSGAILRIDGDIVRRVDGYPLKRVPEGSGRTRFVSRRTRLRTCS